MLPSIHSTIPLAHSTRHGTTRLFAYEWCSTSLDLHCASRPTPPKSADGATVCRRPDQPDRSGLFVALDHHPRPYLLFWPSTWSAGSYWDVSARQPGGRSTAPGNFRHWLGERGFPLWSTFKFYCEGGNSGMTDIRPKAFYSEEDLCQPWYHYYELYFLDQCVWQRMTDAFNEVIIRDQSYLFVMIGSLPLGFQHF